MDEALAYFARVLKRDILTVDDINKWNCEHWKDGFFISSEIEGFSIVSEYNESGIRLTA